MTHIRKIQKRGLVPLWYEHSRAGSPLLIPQPSRKGPRWQEAWLVSQSLPWAAVPLELVLSCPLSLLPWCLLEMGIPPPQDGQAPEQGKGREIEGIGPCLQLQLQCDMSPSFSSLPSSWSLAVPPPSPGFLTSDTWVNQGPCPWHCFTSLLSPPEDTDFCGWELYQISGA